MDNTCSCEYCGDDLETDTLNFKHQHYLNYEGDTESLSSIDVITARGQCPRCGTHNIQSSSFEDDIKLEEYSENQSTNFNGDPELIFGIR